MQSLKPFIPEDALPLANYLIDKYKINLTIVNERQTKHGDFRTFANGRTAAVLGHYVVNFPEINGLAEVNINASPASGGAIYFSTLRLSEPNFPWSGTYFRGIDIPVVARPNRGYVLKYWSDPGLGNAIEVVVNYSSSFNNLVANFEFGSTATDPIVINEINYNSSDFPNAGDWIELYNPNATAVDISGWYFEDSGNDFFGLPANTILGAGDYLLIVEDREEFSLVYPSVQNVYCLLYTSPSPRDS